MVAISPSHSVTSKVRLIQMQHGCCEGDFVVSLVKMVLTIKIHLREKKVWVQGGLNRALTLCGHLGNNRRGDGHLQWGADGYIVIWISFEGLTAHRERQP